MICHLSFVICHLSLGIGHWANHVGLVNGVWRGSLTMQSPFPEMDP